MKKDFDGWNIQKEILHNNFSIPFYKERDIWFCYLGVNIGREEDGSPSTFLRPVVVLRKFKNGTFFGVPLTHTPRFGRNYFTVIDRHGTSFAMLAQGRILDGRRLYYRSRVMPQNDFESLKLRFLLGIL
ncbi:MAG: hypothetical protein ABR884_01730 [Minisyncoccia bacterium]